MATSFTDSSAALLASAGGSGTGLDTSLDALDTAVTAVTILAAITGGESPTEAEFNSLRQSVVDLKACFTSLGD